MPRSIILLPFSKNIAQVLAAAVLALAFASSDVRAQNTPLTEEQIKAGFLFNFTKFVEWPPESFADGNAPMVIGILGDSAIEKLLMEAVVGKSVNGRPVLVKHPKDLLDIKSCQIVFVGSSDEKRAPQIFEALKASSVLTVGETPGFIQAGGMINFFIEENKVRLEINLDAATHVRVKISAKLIAVGRLVSQNAGKGQI